MAICCTREKTQRAAEEADPSPASEIGERIKGLHTIIVEPYFYTTPEIQGTVPSRISTYIRKQNFGSPVAGLHWGRDYLNPKTNCVHNREQLISRKTSQELRICGKKFARQLDLRKVQRNFCCGRPAWVLGCALRPAALAHDFTAAKRPTNAFLPEMGCSYLAFGVIMRPLQHCPCAPFLPINQGRQGRVVAEVVQSAGDQLFCRKG